jgi:hypothetical protein
MPGYASTDPPAKTGFTLSGLSANLRTGQVVCLDPDASGTAKSTNVILPTLRSLDREGFMLHPNYDNAATGSSPWLIPLSSLAYSGVYAWTDQAITDGDVLGPQPATHNWRRGRLYTDYCFVARETVDRSSTPGTVYGEIVPRPSPSLIKRMQYQFDDDFEVFTGSDNGGTAEQIGWQHNLSGSASTNKGSGFVSDGPSVASGVLGAFAIGTGDANGVYFNLWHHDKCWKLQVGRPMRVQFTMVVDATTNIGMFLGFNTAEENIVGLSGGSASVDIFGVEVNTATSATAINRLERVNNGTLTRTAISGVANGTDIVANTRFTVDLLWDGVSKLLYHLNDVLVQTTTLGSVAGAASMRLTSEIRSRALNTSRNMYWDRIAAGIVRR